MNDRPILFSGEMVRAVLGGVKTQTRRVVKPQPHAVFHTRVGKILFGWDNEVEEAKCPYGSVGDRLWVRETFHHEPEWDRPCYRATARDSISRNGYRIPLAELAWTPSIFMPRWASRITLEVVDVRVERVQEISDCDAQAEGVDLDPEYLDRDIPYFVPCFQRLWDSINGKPRKDGVDISWSANPWVWVVEFKNVEGS